MWFSETAMIYSISGPSFWPKSVKKTFDGEIDPDDAKLHEIPKLFSILGELCIILLAILSKALILRTR